jgi:hypothetical protein
MGEPAVNWMRDLAFPLRVRTADRRHAASQVHCLYVQATIASPHYQRQIVFLFWVWRSALVCWGNTELEVQEPPSHSIFELNLVLRKPNDTSLSSLDGHDYSPAAGVLRSNVLGNKDFVTDVKTTHSAALRVYGRVLEFTQNIKGA